MPREDLLPLLLTVRTFGIGGCERDLVKLAIGLNRSRFTPHVGCFYPEGMRLSELYEAGIPVVAFPLTSFKNPRLLWKAALAMRSYMRQHRIRLVHSFDVPTNLFTVPVARICGVTAVSSQLSYRTLYSATSHRLLRITDHLSQKVVVNCEAMRRHLIEDEGCPPDRLFVSYNGVDPGVFHPGPVSPPYPLGRARLVIGTVAGLRPEKGLHLLIDAFARLRRRHTGLMLVLVGSGSSEGELRERVRASGILPEECHFEPGRPDVADWMRSMDIFVLPSLSEAFSNSLLEAMASGCCVIASDVGGLPEMIAHGKRGLLFRTGDADDLFQQLELVVEQSELRKRWGEAAAKFAHENLSMEQAVRRMEKFYLSLMAQS